VGSYDVLSGFSHPSVWFGFEHRRVGEDSAVTYEYRLIDVDKLTRLAVQAFMDAEIHWVGYYVANDPDAIGRITELGEKLDAISLSLGPSDGAEEGCPAAGSGT
jgi:hypothetical protein